MISLHTLLREKLLSQPLVHADETTVQVLKEPGRRPEQQSYLWLFRSGANPGIRDFLSKVFIDDHLLPVERVPRVL